MAIQKKTTENLEELRRRKQEGRESGGAERVEPAIVRVADGRADPGVVGDVGGAQHALLEQRVAGGQSHVERLRHEVHGREPALVPVRGHALRVGEHDVEVGGELGEVGEGEVLVGHEQAQRGLALERAQRARQQHLPRGREGAERHRAGRGLLVLRPQGFG